MSLPPAPVVPTTDILSADDASLLATDCGDGGSPTSTTSRSAVQFVSAADGDSGSVECGDDETIATRIVMGGETERFCGEAIGLCDVDGGPPLADPLLEAADIGWALRGLLELGECGKWFRIRGADVVIPTFRC